MDTVIAIQRLAFVIISIVMSATVCFGGRGDKTGTAAATELLIPVGARSVAIAGSGLSTMIGVESIQWNPSGLAWQTSSAGFLVSHMTYLADISVEYAVLGVHMGDLATFGLSIKSLFVGDIVVTTEDHPDGTGETTSPTMTVVGGTLARRLSDRIALGVTANFVYEKMAKVSASGIAINAGLQYIGLGGIEGLRFGVLVRNLGPKLHYDGDGLIRQAIVDDALRSTSPVRLDAASADLPSTIEIGLGYSYSLSRSSLFTFSSAFQNNNFSDDEYRFGGEYIVDNAVSIRSGYVYSAAATGNGYIFGFSAGIGIHTNLQNIDILADYAYRAVKYFSGNHVISLTVAF